MKTLSLSLLLILATAFSAFGQERTDETRVTINPKTGDTTLTNSIVVSSVEDITPRGHMIIINPLKFLLFYNISYFQKISDNIVLGGGIQVPTVSGLNGFGVNAEIRIHPNGKNLKGFYFAPNISFNHLTSDDESTSPFSVGVLAGWQWFPGEQFALGFGIGLDYYIGSIESSNGDLESYNGAVPALRFDIGYAW